VAYLTEVPGSFWRVACEKQHHPLACVTEENYFFWVNEAFERLLGYSQRELEQKTWMDITVAQDVGGDLASAKDLLDGKKSRYTMTKRYVHKMGHIVKVSMTVIRLPQDAGRFLCYIVEAIPEVAHLEDIDEIKKIQTEQNERTAVMIQALVSRLEVAEARSVNSNSDSRTSSTINVGNNSTVIIVVIAIALVALGYMYLTAGKSASNEHRPHVEAKE